MKSILNERAPRAKRSENQLAVNRMNRSNGSVTVAAQFTKGAATVMERFEQVSGFSLMVTKPLRHATRSHPGGARNLWSKLFRDNYDRPKTIYHCRCRLDRFAFGAADV